ncbi:hypothetical protein A2524_04085 [Candidatus Wolfebacteria bacterium RIFOXYD12_FULL_48_21]|uniref:Type II secretion system protein GspG C-terminal domain-containing protein n=1 Tax=Candidatus Wolfebacteria bacterium RIFOXYD1_FULL_48_65 TaxID=1802561 RepID=A0A1F8E0Y7_9BACT|nr:MAG: hypothetical protein A2610_00470 [Candidatus Wolfebacteria bacterium RIFOXYD1_FULL_48_65]OGM95221.1 MAG: hypothetical protein A2524_04085 [Candidatus Wolfebacteria bacterium RIFOXYD12_FULL_48_21]OGM96398.1 MAG: hypothetical protein A2532_00690 [Candidatus Wolfebacteria bacterium RIFOXYD2_FULL_48_11]
MIRTKGFTLLELLITIGILAVLATTAVLVINPVEYLRQSRDTRRIGDLDAISKAIDLYTINKPAIAELGTVSIVYISLPDTSSTCGSHSLPLLPSPWQYRCATTANLQKVDGTGWLPINFSSVSGGAPLATLPIDPVNGAANLQYYAFTASGRKYEVFSVIESENNFLGGPNDKISSDGGDDFTRYEVGSDLTIAPWSFEFDAFPLATSGSKKPGWYKIYGDSFVSIESDAETANFLRLTTQVWYEWQENILYNPNSVYKVEVRARLFADPAVGYKFIYTGFVGVAANGVSRSNITGASGTNAQHFRGFRGEELDVTSGWTIATDYSGGYGSPQGTNTNCTDPNNPCLMHAAVRYIRPLLMVGEGTTDIDYIKVTKQ